MTTFESRWSGMEPGKGFQRIDENHPLDFYLGLDVSGERVLLLVTEENVDVATQSQAIQVLIRQRQDGRWALMFRLIKPELGRIFSHLCEDIVEYGRKLIGKSNPAESVIKRFMHWQRLLERSQSGLLDLESQRGLLGELLFLLHFALPSFALMQAVEGWEGPLDVAQDFNYPNGLFEVKSIRSGTSKVMISSADQLDDMGKPLQLVAVILDSADRGDADAFCLPDIVNDVRQRLEEDSIALSIFEERLLIAGYIDSEEYRHHYYKYGKSRFFTVCEGFPRIMRSRLLSGIGKVIYELDLAACKPFETYSKAENSDGY